MRIRLTYKGGPGSGHAGHAGRPGQHGGSLPGKGGVKLQRVDMGNKPAYQFADQVVSAQREELEQEALRVGEEQYGDSSTGFIHQPHGDNRVDAETPSDRRKLFMLPDDEDEPLTFPDSCEFLFGYDPNTGKGYKLDYKKDGFGADDELYGDNIEDFYGSNPDKLLVSYGAEDGRVTVWKP